MRARSEPENAARHAPARLGRFGLVLVGALGCSLDFDVAGREFECPPELTGCLACNADGSCREPAVIVEPVRPVSPEPESPAPGADAGPSGGGGGRPPVEPPPEAPPEPPPPEVPPEPPPPEVPPELAPCAEHDGRASDELCLGGSDRCFSLGSVLSPALTAWLDPTTLPEQGSRLWCDRSGRGHHARLEPESAEPLVSDDGRTADPARSRSLALDGAWLSLGAGSEPVLGPGNFAVLIAAATPLEGAAAPASFGLFESGAASKVAVRIAPERGQAEANVASTETALVPGPVVTQSSVDDGRFHLYTLYRRSEVRVLDDVLQLRLNGVLEFRGSSVAIPRALDLSASPGVGRGAEGAPGGGRVAAVVILRGSVPEDELARLESFLCRELAVCAAPGPRSGSDAADGGAP